MNIDTIIIVGNFEGSNFCQVTCQSTKLSLAKHDLVCSCAMHASNIAHLQMVNNETFED